MREFTPPRIPRFNFGIGLIPPLLFGCEVDEVIIEVPAGSLWRISSGSGSTLEIEILLGRLTFGVDFLEEDF